MVRCMEGDVDIMGVQRGAHKDGEHICPGFVFKVPGGTQEDGTPLWVADGEDLQSADMPNCVRCAVRATGY